MSGRSPRNTRLSIEQLERRELLSASLADPLSPAALGAAAAVRDDFGSTFPQAAQVTLTATGSGYRLGAIETAGDVDVFRFVAPVTGKMTIRELILSGSKLNPYLYVYGPDRRFLAGNNNTGGTVNSQVQIDVVAGTAYYVRATGCQQTTGSYVVRWSTAVAADDYGNTLAQAANLNLAATGSASQAGKIEKSGDVDMFRFVAPVTGKMTVREVAASASMLDPYLSVYSANQQLLAEDDDSGGVLNSQVEIDVVAGATYYLKAAGYPGSSGAYSLELSTATGTPSAFQIDVVTSGLTASQESIVQQAADRWEEIIIGDVPDVLYQGQRIDDVRIDVSAIPIDGQGGILGWAGITAFRAGSYLPYVSFFQFDTADVTAMQADGMLLPVMVHEMAHALGFGVIWDELGLVADAGTSAPGFIGARALAQYNTLFGTSATAVPLESGGGPGTALVHWSESVFQQELMTGWINWSQTLPISRITVASMADLGYQVNMAAADPYVPPAALQITPASTSTSAPGSRTSYYLDSLFDTNRNSSRHNRQNERLRAVDQYLQWFPHSLDS